ncbi:class II fructose-bisphosphate aldolase [Nanoarchaeota archaeon]
MKPIAGSKLFNALRVHKCIIMAWNGRIDAGVIKGLFRAAKEMDAALMMELARTECNLQGGYTGFTPETYNQACQKASEETGHDIWAQHADHTFVKKGTPEEIAEVKELIKGQIAAGYTSFAIDASHLFNFEGKSTIEELDPNIKTTIELANFIKQEYDGDDFGLEVEVGEIGRKDTGGMVLTTPEEATIYITTLNQAGIKPHVIAIANGSTHGNVYDNDGNMIEQVSINIEQTKAIAKALEDQGSKVRIAQHGITGTPLHLIKEKFPHGDIIKGNVATFWMNLVWDILKEKQPELYKEIWDWTISKYKETMPDKKDNEIFGKTSKYAVKEFKQKLDNLDAETKKIIEDKTYEEAKKFFQAFKAEGSAKIVRDTL